MKLVTKQELLNYPEGTYYTQFRNKKILATGNIKKVGKYNNIQILQFSHFLKQPLFTRLIEFKNSLVNCPEQANYCVWTDKEKRYLERVEFVLPVWVNRRTRILTEKLLAEEAAKDPNVVILDFLGRLPIEARVERHIKSEFLYKFIDSFIVIDYTYIENLQKINRSQKRIITNIKEWPIPTTPIGALFEENSLRQIVKFCISLNDRHLVKRINKVRYRTNIFTRRRNV